MTNMNTTTAETMEKLISSIGCTQPWTVEEKELDSLATVCRNGWKVYLSLELSTYSDGQINTALAHELSHVICSEWEVENCKILKGHGYEFKLICDILGASPYSSTKYQRPDLDSLDHIYGMDITDLLGLIDTYHQTDFHAQREVKKVDSFNRRRQKKIDAIKNDWRKCAFCNVDKSEIDGYDYSHDDCRMVKITCVDDADKIIHTTKTPVAHWENWHDETMYSDSPYYYKRVKTVPAEKETIRGSANSLKEVVS